MSKSNKFCQSCGMPIKKDSHGGGTNADGSKNLEFCSYCFQNGRFTFECENVYVFQDYCKNKMIENGQSKFISWLLTRGMKRLSRWRNK